MTKAYDPATGEINPGGVLSDPDYGPESWEDMTVDEYIGVIYNYGDDHISIRDVLRHMPDDIYDEYVQLDYPELPDELRPDYEEPVEPEEEEEEEED